LVAGDVGTGISVTIGHAHAAADDFTGDGTSDILLRDPTGGGIGEFQMRNNQPTWVPIGWAASNWQVTGNLKQPQRP
jgi:hypothetical protein